MSIWYAGDRVAKEGAAVVEVVLARLSNQGYVGGCR